MVYCVLSLLLEFYEVYGNLRKKVEERIEFIQAGPLLFLSFLSKTFRLRTRESEETVKTMCVDSHECMDSKTKLKSDILYHKIHRSLRLSQDNNTTPDPLKKNV